MMAVEDVSALFVYSLWARMPLSCRATIISGFQAVEVLFVPVYCECTDVVGKLVAFWTQGSKVDRRCDLNPVARSFLGELSC